MPCFTPLKAYRAPGGRVVFTAKEGYADRHLELPCGQCMGCRIERSRQWAIRCVHEAQCHASNSFVTLTYDPEHLPRDHSLDVTHWQKFAKRLRKRVGPFRFFHCGEYGEKNLRPHYHALLFGVDFVGDRELWKVAPGGHRIYTSELLAETWGLGFTTVGELTYESAAYVARYVMKKANGDLAEERYSRVDQVTGEVHRVKPEYVSMSRRPGIGTEWFDRFRGDVYPADEVVHDGRRFRPPRFYDDKVEPEILESLKAKRRDKVCARREDLTPERLRTKEKLQTRRLQELERRL